MSEPTDEPDPKPTGDEPASSGVPANEAPLAEALADVLRRIVDRGRQELGRAANQGRVRLELRQLQRDRDQFWIRLGKSAYRLVEGGEIDHPALRKAMLRIDELEAQIAKLKEEGVTDGGGDAG